MSEYDHRFARLRRVVEQNGGNEAVARKAGIGTTTLSKYLNGSEWKLSNIVRLGNACGVSPSWLAFGPPSDNEIDTLKNEDALVEIPFYDLKDRRDNCFASESNPTLIRYPISSKLLQELDLDSRETSMIRIDGDSMEPTIRSGDIVLIDMRRSKILTGLAVLVVVGQPTVKRLIPNPSGTMSLSADNKLYPTHEVEASRLKWDASSDGDAISIIGRVAYRFQAI